MADTGIKFGTTYSRLGEVIGPLEFAQRTEAMGYDSLWVPDVLLWPSLEPFTFLSAAAARTSRISLGTAVGVLPFKHPILWAKAALSLQEISAGRLTLGLGIGGTYRKELEILGLNMEDRASMSDETLAVMRRLLTEENVTHEGKFFRFQDVTIRAMTGEGAHVPFWLGADWHGRIAPGALKRADRL